VGLHTECPVTVSEDWHTSCRETGVASAARVRRVLSKSTSAGKLAASIVSQIVLAVVAWRFLESVDASTQSARSCWSLSLIQVQMSPLYPGVGVGIRLAADSQLTSSSWYRAPLWGPWPDFIFFFSFDNYFAVFPRVSLTRGRVCSLQCNPWLDRSLTTNNHTLPSHLRLCSLFVASYNSQGIQWRYSNSPPHGVVSRHSRWPSFIPCQLAGCGPMLHADWLDSRSVVFATKRAIDCQDWSQWRWLGRSK
jgi:hypothetical protein